MRMTLLGAWMCLAACSNGPGSGEDAGAASSDAGSVDAGKRDAGPPPWTADWFATEVTSVQYGSNAGFGQENYPVVVLGAPSGAGAHRGSLDVLTLGHGGVITLKVGRDIEDGPGADFIVFENAFVEAGTDRTNAEPAEVAVSDDGATWTVFPCDHGAWPFAGCAGVHPVLATGPDNDIDPRDPSVAGGDPFDLAGVGVARARFVRITDRSLVDQPGETAGFDLDAVAVVQHPSH